MTRAAFIIFSDARAGVIRALVHEHGRLPVFLYREQDNRVDPDAVAVVSTLPPFVVGGRPVYNAVERVGQRIGYVARADDGKRDLAALLAQQDAPIAASLVIDGPDWWIELAGEPDDQDEEVPY